MSGSRCSTPPDSTSTGKPSHSSRPSMGCRTVSPTWSSRSIVGAVPGLHRMPISWRRNTSGAKAALRPICDRLLAEAEALGADVEVAPKKTGVSLRRSKQFALVEAPSAKRIQLGLNLRGVAATERLRSMNGMCTHRVDLTSVNDVDDEVQGWLRAAYDLA